MLLGVWIVKLREAQDALQESYDAIEVRVKERTHELSTEIEYRKRMELELRDSEERFKSLSDASFHGIVLTEQGRIFECNKTVREMVGYKRSELVGMIAIDLILPEEREKVQTRMQSGSEAPYESIGMRKDGSTFPIEVQAKKLSYKDREVRVTAICDLTEQKNAEQEIETLRGILPICSFCKKIRNDKGDYEKIEAYIERNSEVDFSHTVCPACMQKHYPEILLSQES